MMAIIAIKNNRLLYFQKINFHIKSPRCTGIKQSFLIIFFSQYVFLVVYAKMENLSCLGFI